MFKNHAFESAIVNYFGGGSAPAPPKQKMPEMPEMPAIPNPPPPKPPPPPPSMSQLEVKEAEDQQRRDAAKRKGMRTTLLAGEGPTSSATGKASLLG